jgi:hypothetical protein
MEREKGRKKSDREIRDGEGGGLKCFRRRTVNGGWLSGVEITRPKAAAATVDRRSIERVIYGRSSAFDEKEWGGGKGGGYLGVVRGSVKKKKKKKKEKRRKKKSDRSDALQLHRAASK